MPDALTPSPLAEADPRSLDDVMSSRPPFDAGALTRMVAELRRMRVKWQQDEAEGKASKQARAKRGGTKATSAPASVDDLWDEGGTS